MTSSALLVIDVQEGLVAGAYREQETLDAINTVIAECHRKSTPVVFLQHCHSYYQPLMKGNPGWEVHPYLFRDDSDIYIEKTASDSFYETELEGLLSSRGIDHLIVTGLQTEYCVDTTCRSALSLGFSVTLVTDAHTTGGASLPEQQVIDYHNEILSNLAHPHCHITLLRSSEVTL